MDFQRIREARKAAGITQDELAKKLGVNRATISKYETGAIDLPSSQLQRLADALGVHVLELVGVSKAFAPYDITVSGMDADSISDITNAFNLLSDENKAECLIKMGVAQPDCPASSQHLPPNIIPRPRTYKVPLIGTIACGQPILAVENADETVDVPDYIQADFALRCKGDSMINARIFDGDIVYIHSQPEVENGQIAAVRIGEEATLKKVYFAGRRLVLRAANPLYDDMEYEGEALEGVEILGKAVAFTSTIR